MSNTYNGNDRVDNFFAHYGRKGMKKGMNIFNPDYTPIGKKAKQLYTVAKVTSKIKSAEQTAEKLYSTGSKARNLIGNIRSDLQAKRNDAKNAEYQKQYEKEQREKDRRYAAERTAGNRRLAEAAAIESSMNSRNRSAQTLEQKPQSISRANAEADAKNKAAIASNVYAAQKKEELRRQALLDAEKARYSKMNIENTEKAQKKKERDALKEEIEADIKKDLGNAANELSAIEKKVNEVKDKATDYASTAINTLVTVAKNEFGVSLDALKSDKDIAKILDFDGIKFSEMSLEDQKLIIEAKVEKLKKTLKEKAEKAAKTAVKNKFDELISKMKKAKQPSAAKRVAASVVSKMLAHSDEDRVERFFNSRREVITDANV